MDEAEDTAARAEAWKRYTDRLYTEGSPLLGRVLDAGLELSGLRGAYDVLCEHGDVLAASASEGPAPDLSAARRQVEAYLDRAVSELPATVPRAGWDRLQVALRAADRLRTLVDLSSTPQFVAVLRELDYANKTDQRSWPSAQAA
jgi:hypothetical protein